MTREAIEQGQRIQARIDEINNILHDIRPYFHNDIEIDILNEYGILTTIHMDPIDISDPEVLRIREKMERLKRIKQHEQE